ncbi:hypothetical protein V1505DRAFT_350836 [Lipomyces doorenjongii]
MNLSAEPDSGFEVYESVTNEYIHNGIYDEIGAPERRALTCKEILESLRTRCYELEEDLLEQVGPEERTRIMEAWLASLRKSSHPYLTDENLDL